MFTPSTRPPRTDSIERFHSRGQGLCKFIETKESIWDTNMAVVLLFWDTNMAAVTSCENTTYRGSIDRITLTHGGYESTIQG